MDINKEYAAHQYALMRADHSAGKDDRRAHLAQALSIAGRISAFQRELGAAAAGAWSTKQVSGRVRADSTSPAHAGALILLSLKFDGYRRFGFRTGNSVSIPARRRLPFK